MKTLITGMHKGELLPPYKDSFDKEKIESIHSYLNLLDKNDRINCISNVDAKKELIKLRDKELQIIGSYEEHCVAATVSIAISMGISTFSPEKYLFGLYNSDNLKKGVDFFRNNFIKIVGPNSIKIGLGGEIKNYDYSFEKGVHLFKPIF